MREYDIVITGAGASGVFMAYELTKINNNARILMIDRGAPLATAAQGRFPTENTTSPPSLAATFTSTSEKQRPWS